MAKPKDTKFKVVYRNIDELTPLENNPRWIKEDDFNRLCASVQNNPELFEAQPIILSDRTGELVIIAGNQRYKAAQTVGLKEVPTVLLTGLTEAKEKEIIIRTNVTNGKWDYDALANGDWDVNELGDWGVDVSFMGVDESDSLDLDGMFDKEEEKVEEEPEETEEDIIISVCIPFNMSEQTEEIIAAVQQAISNYEGVKVQ